VKAVRVLLGGVLILVVSFGAAGCGDSSGSRAKSEPQGKPDGYVRVTRVIDGDTVVLTRVGTTRLIGVDAPEQGRCYETEATRFTRERLEGERVGYEFDKDRKDRYGRNLLYLYRDGMHNLALVEEGYAEPETIWPDVKYAARFNEADRRAESSRKGRFSGECERRRRAAALKRQERRAAREQAEERRRAARRRAREERQAEEYLRSYEDKGDRNVGG